jgi:hypothetical protein
MAASRSPKKRTPQTRSTSTRRKRNAGADESLPRETLALQRQESELRTLVEQFHSGDRPAFDAWMDSCFGQERTEGTRLHDEADKLECLLDEADLACESGDYDSLREALLAEMEREKRASDPASPAPGDDDDAPMPDDVADFLFGEFMAEMRGVKADKMDPTAYAKAKADFLAGLHHAKEGDKIGFEKALMKAGADESDGNVREVKAAYRRLAKRLHPDSSGSWDEGERRLWDEASRAYQALDLGGLQRIDLMLTLERGEPVPAGQARELRRLHDKLFRTVINLGSELAELREHPGWEFGKRKKTKAFRERIQGDLDEFIHAGRERLKRLQMEIRSILGPQRKGKGKGKGTRQAKAPSRPRSRPADEQFEMPF